MSLIPGNTKSSVIISDILKADSIISDIITDGTMIFQNGKITNLSQGTELQDIVSKSQVEETSQPGGSNGSIQCNKNNGFTGSSDFKFVNNNELIVDIITDLTGMKLSNNKITNVEDPSNGTDILNKRFVDTLSAKTVVTKINSDVGVVWAPENMMGIILRNSTDKLSSNASPIDMTPTAAEIIGAYPGIPSVGAAFPFLLINENIELLNYKALGTVPQTYAGQINDLFQVSFIGGTGVTISPGESFIIPRTYTMYAFVIFTSVTPGNEAVLININSIDWISKFFFFQPKILNKNIETTTGVDITLNNYFTNQDLVTKNSSINVSYSTDIQKGLILRNPATNSNDTINPSVFDSCSPSQLFKIINSGTGIISISQNGLSTFSPNPIIIQPNKTSTMILTTNPEPIISDGPNGNYNTVNPITILNGSGTGMTIIPTLVSILFSGSPGIGYTTGIYNTSGGSGTGLTIQISDVNSDTTVSVMQKVDPVYLKNLGYEHGDTVSVIGGNLIVYIIINGISSIKITDFGTGYVTGDVLTVRQAEYPTTSFNVINTSCTFTLSNLYSITEIMNSD